MFHHEMGFMRSFKILFLTVATALFGQSVEPVVVVGSGVGALTSALYLARAGFSPLVITGPAPGGLLIQSHAVQNWPGEYEISGQDLVDKIRTQAEKNGVRFLSGDLVEVDFSARPLSLTVKTVKEKISLLAQSSILATGTTPRFLGIPGERQYWGNGVSNCAICDGFFFKGLSVGVVGGGDAAVLEALYLSELAKEVYVFVRKDKFKATEEKRLETLLSRPNVRVLYNTVVEAILGDEEGVKKVKIATPGRSKEVSLSALFLAIGSIPNTSFLQGKLELDRQGYIVVQDGQKTSVPGVFAVGDVSDPIYKQAITAAGDGAKAAMEAQEFLSLQPPVARMAAKIKSAQKVEEISTLEELQAALQGDTPVLVDFYAPWCGPCKRLSPMIDASAEELGGKVRFLKVNVDKAQELSSLYRIRSMPTAILFDEKGNVQERKTGGDEIANLLNRLESRF